jgi:hypothetical protein
MGNGICHNIFHADSRENVYRSPCRSILLFHLGINHKKESRRQQQMNNAQHQTTQPDMSEACAAPTPLKRKRHPLRKFIGCCRCWMYLNIWCRHLYRPTMRIMHKMNLHHAPPSQITNDERRGERNHWCQWCGLRGTTYTINDKLAREIAAELTELTMTDKQ